MTETAADTSAARSSADMISLVIAVTGHRTIAESARPKLERAFTDLLVQLRTSFPHTPLRLMSGLAEGADRLAARCARTLGDVELIAVLPRPVADYEQDFASPESVVEFREFLGTAKQIVVTGEESSSHQLDHGQSSLYARQGAWMVQACDVLVAFWDGEPAAGAGGTGNIVRFRIDGVPKVFSPARTMFEKRTGAVYHIITPRDDSSTKLSMAGQTQLVSPGGSHRTAFAISELNPAMAAIDVFNRDLASQSSMPDDSSLKIPADHLLADVSNVERQALLNLRRRFDAVDQLASRFQRRTWMIYKTMLACSVASLVCLQLHSSSSRSSGPFLALYLVLLMTAYVLYGLSKRNRYESRAFDYRAIAEGLRVQYFWRIAGLSAAVADQYLSRHQDVLAWIRRALAVWTAEATSERGGARGTEDPVQASGEPRLPLASGLSPLALKGNSERLAFVLAHWIEDQLRYFQRASEKQRRLQQGLSRMANALVLLGILLAAFKLMAGPAAWWMPLAAAPPVIAAALLAYGNTRALSEQVNQYDSMRELFAVAAEQLRHRVAAGDVAAGGELLWELGKEALAENADWLQLHRRRPVSQPKVGL